YGLNNPANLIDPSGEIAQMLQEKFQNIKTNLSNPSAYVRDMGLVLKDPVARGFLMDELSTNCAIVGAASGVVGFGPGAAVFTLASKAITITNGADTARGVAAGEVPTFV